MDIIRMHDMIEKLSECAKCEIDKGIENIDPREMGQVTDMMKDLAEAMYYRTLMKAMEESSADETMEMFERFGDDRRFYDNYRYASGRFAPKGRGIRRGYDEIPYYHMMPEMRDSMEHDRDMDRTHGRMYYTEPVKVNMSESNYDKAKRHYTESKELHKANTTEDKEQKMKSLDGYMKELSSDVTELLHDMTAEERTMLKSKLSNLVSKL